MRDPRNYIPILITACNVTIAILFTFVEATGSFPDSLQPYKGLFILYYFFSWLITLILISVLLVIIIKNLKSGAKELPPYLILFPNVGYLVYIWFLLYFEH